MRTRCPIGPLNAHTYNYERDECIWCGPNSLASKPGRWVPLGDGTSAWSAIPPAEDDDLPTLPTPVCDHVADAPPHRHIPPADDQGDTDA